MHIVSADGRKYDGMITDFIYADNSPNGEAGQSIETTITTTEAESKTFTITADHVIVATFRQKETQKTVPADCEIIGRFNGQLFVHCFLISDWHSFYLGMHQN